MKRTIIVAIVATFSLAVPVALAAAPADTQTAVSLHGLGSPNDSQTGSLRATRHIGAIKADTQAPACADNNNSPGDPANPWTFPTDNSCLKPTATQPNGGSGNTYINNDCTLASPGLYKNTATNQATAAGEQSCNNAIDSQSAFVNLYEFWVSDDTWHLMTSGTVNNGGPGQLTPMVRLRCNTSDVRFWSAYTSGTFAESPRFYRAQHYQDGYLNCKG